MIVVDFTTLVGWIVFNCVLSVLVAVLTTYKLALYGDMLNFPERVGMGAWGASAVMRVALLWDYRREGTPFTDWSTSLMLIGTLVYLAGRLSRHIRHQKRNLRQQIIAEEHFKDRG